MIIAVPMTRTALRALLNVETLTISRSWLVRMWVAFALLTSILPVLVASGQEETVSEVIGGWLVIYFIPSAIIAGVLGAAALAQDTEVAADSILTRAVTRYDYVCARLVARAATVLLVHAVATMPLLLFARRFGLDDATTGGLIWAALVTGVMLVFVAALGVALGAVLRNMIFAVIALMVVFAAQGLIFDFLNLPYLSSNTVLADLPETIRGELGAWHSGRVILAFGSAALALAALAGYAFDQREF